MKPVDPIQFTAPFRVGRRLQRVVLDSKSREVVIFREGMEDWAEEYVQFLNKKHYGFAFR